MRTSLVTALGVVVVVSFLTLAPAALAGVPDNVAFTALLKAGGVPVNGPQVIELRLFDANEGGVALWTETYPAANAVDGRVYLSLGTNTPGLQNQFNGAARFLEIVVNSQVMTPRLPVVSVPYAFHAKVADDLAGHSGAVMHFATASCPSGWLPANGAAVSRTSYADLFAAMGTLWGSGDGATTFNLPDLRGEFIRGLDGGRGVDPGRGLGSFQAQNFKTFDVMNSNGPTTSYVHGPLTVPKSGWSGPLFGGEWNTPTGLIQFNWTSSDNSEVRPRNVALLVCVKT